MSEQQEKKNRTIAIFSAIGLHSLLFLLMFLIIAWVPPDPPLGAGGGMEVIYGLDNEGSGDVKPTEPIGSEGKQNDAPQNTEQQEQTSTPTETHDQVAEEKSTAKAEDDIKTESQLESPIKVAPTKKEEVKSTDKPINPVKVPEKKEPQVVKPQDVYQGTKTATSSDKAGDGKEGKAGNFGDDKGKTGDKGNPQGTPDGKSLYGNPGSGNTNGPGGGPGFGLQMSGWDWDLPPNKPQLVDKESGFVIFEVTIDDQGDITAIETIENTLSPDAVKRCEQKIKERSFIRKAGGVIPNRSTGRVTFTYSVK
jgi:protein TonB